MRNSMIAAATIPVLALAFAYAPLAYAASEFTGSITAGSVLSEEAANVSGVLSGSVTGSQTGSEITGNLGTSGSGSNTSNGSGNGGSSSNLNGRSGGGAAFSAGGASAGSPIILLAQATPVELNGTGGGDPNFDIYSDSSFNRNIFSLNENVSADTEAEAESVTTSSLAVLTDPVPPSDQLAAVGAIPGEMAKSLAIAIGILALTGIGGYALFSLWRRGSRY